MNGYVVLMVLMCGLGPSLEVMGSHHLEDIVHHLERKFGRERGESQLGLKGVCGFFSQRLKLGYECVNFSRDKCKVV